MTGLNGCPFDWCNQAPPHKHDLGLIGRCPFDWCERDFPHTHDEESWTAIRTQECVKVGKVVGSHRAEGKRPRPQPPQKPSALRLMPIALILSAFLPGAGSFFVKAYWSGVRSSLLFSLACWAALGNWPGKVLCAVVWVYVMSVTVGDVAEYTHGFRHMPSYLTGYRAGRKERSDER